jgi:hypothetical protein
VERALGELREEAGGDAEALNRGGTVRMLGADVPSRVLVAIGIFVAVFVLVYLLAWTVLGGLGLALGWILAMVVGSLAVKLFASRADR